MDDPALLRGWGSWETIKSTAPNGGKQIDFVLVGRDDPTRRMLAVKASEVKPDDRCVLCPAMARARRGRSAAAVC